MNGDGIGKESHLSLLALQAKEVWGPRPAGEHRSVPKITAILSRVDRGAKLGQPEATFISNVSEVSGRSQRS